MIKVCECSLCGKYFRTGQIRQVIEKAMGEGNKWVEWRKAVCNNCYKTIIKGEGVASFGFEGGSGDDTGDWKVYSKDFLIGSKEVVKAAKDIEDAVKSKKERKPRGKRVKSDKSLGTETIEDIAKKIEQIKTVKEEPKKRGRKPKDKDPLATEASADDKVFSAINDVRDESLKPKIDEETGDVIATIADAIETVDSEPASIRPVSSKDRNTLKNQVRQALENNPEVLYSKIAEKLGIDEGLVSQLVDELELEAAG